MLGEGGVTARSVGQSGPVKLDWLVNQESPYWPSYERPHLSESACRLAVVNGV